MTYRLTVRKMYEWMIEIIGDAIWKDPDMSAQQLLELVKKTSSRYETNDLREHMSPLRSSDS